MTTPSLSSLLSRPLLKSRINPKPHVEVNACDQNSDLNWCSNLHLVYLCSNTYFYNTQEYLYTSVENTYPLRRYMLFHCHVIFLRSLFVACYFLQTGAQWCTSCAQVQSSQVTVRDGDFQWTSPSQRQGSEDGLCHLLRSVTLWTFLLIQKHLWHLVEAFPSHHGRKCQEQQIKRREVQDRSSLCSKNIFQEISVGLWFALPSDWKYIIASCWRRSHLCKIANEAQHAGGFWVSRNIVAIVQELCQLKFSRSGTMVFLPRVQMSTWDSSEHSSTGRWESTWKQWRSEASNVAKISSRTTTVPWQVRQVPGRQPSQTCKTFLQQFCKLSNMNQSIRPNSTE